MNKTDNSQTHKINTIAVVVAGLSALTGILIYLDKQKHNKVQGEILKLDKTIKELQLQKLQK